MSSGDILDQSEVDALLSAVDDGDIIVDVEDTRSKDHIKIYDFKRPERVSKDQMRYLESLHEVFARNLAANLSGFLRTIIEINLVSIDQMTYSEFIMSLPNPTCFNLISCEPLEGNFILEINHSIVFPIIDRMLGGGKTISSLPERSLTDIEWKLISTIIEHAVSQLRNKWADVKEINFKVKANEDNPQLMQIVAPNEPVVLITFEVAMGEYVGMMSLCIPFMVIEPIVPELATTRGGLSYGSRAANKDFKSTIVSNISPAMLEITAILAETNITIDSLVTLEVGDIIKTSKLKTTPFSLTIQGKKKFVGKLGKLKGHKSIQILGRSKDFD